MLDANLNELSKFLSEWYGVESLSLSISDEYDAPEPLLQAWRLFGKLWPDNYLSRYEKIPLGTQDLLSGPSLLPQSDGHKTVVSECQECWNITVKSNDEDEDPKVYSTFLADAAGVYEPVLLGCRLTDLIITTVLTETIYYSHKVGNPQDNLAIQCDLALWEGHYYSAEGYPEHEGPSNFIRVNSDRTLMTFDWGNEFSGFVGQRKLGRENLKKFRILSERC